jgi:hypothetical protein
MYMNEKITPYKWTEEKTNKLKSLYQNTKNETISSILNIPINIVIYKAYKLNLKKSKQFKGELIGKRNKLIGRNLNYESLKTIAKQYKTKGEFQQKDSSAYTTARIAGFLPQICSHMSVVSFSIPQLILQDIMDFFLKSKSLYNSRKIITPYEVDIFYPKFNLAFEYNGKGWHENNKRDNNKKKLFLDKNINIIYITENSRNYEEDIKQQLIENLKKINNVCYTNITEDDIKNYKIGNVYLKIYNKEDLFNVAKKYTSYRDFRTKEKSVYNKLLKMGLLKEATEHIKDKIKPHILEEIKSTISKYTKLSDLITYDKGTYIHIQRNNLHYLINHLESKYKHQV